MRQAAWSLLGMALLGAYSSLAAWQNVRREAEETERWLFEASEVPLWLAALVAAGVLVACRAELRRALGEGRPAPWLGGALLLAAVGLHGWGVYVSAPDLVLISLVPFLLGAALLVAGGALARALVAPCLLLLFAVPLPGVASNAVLYGLQEATAAAAAAALRVLGVPVAAEGMALRLPQKTVMIIESCSGLASMWMLTMLAVAYVGFFRPRRLHAWVLVLSAPPLAFGINILRVLAVAFDPNAGDLAAHTTQGLIAFAVAVGLLTGLDVALGRLWPREPAAGAEGTAGPVGPRTIAALAVCACVMAAVQLGGPRFVPRPGGFLVPAFERLGDWRLEPSDAGRDLESVGFTWTSQRRYRRGDEVVDIFLGYDERLDRRRSAISGKNARTGEDLALEERRSDEQDRTGLQREWVLERSGAHRRMAVSSYAGTRSWPSELLRALFALDQSPLRRELGVRVLRIQTDVDPGPGGREAAEERIEYFFDFYGRRLGHSLDRAALRGNSLGKKVVAVPSPFPTRRGIVLAQWGRFRAVVAAPRASLLPERPASRVTHSRRMSHTGLEGV